jgi:hypothetical protein
MKKVNGSFDDKRMIAVPVRLVAGSIREELFHDAFIG